MQLNLMPGRNLVVGDITCESYWSGSIKRISPEAPVPVVNLECREDKPGGAGNVAFNMSKISPNVLLLGMLGKDDHGKKLAKLFAHSKVNTYIQYVDQPTITKLRVLSHHQQLIRLDFEESYFHQNNCDQLFAYFNQQLSNYDVVTLSDHGKGTLANVQNYIDAAKKCCKPVIVNPVASDDLSQYSDATLLILSIDEILTTGIDQIDDENVLQQRAQYLIHTLHLEALLVLCAKDGMILFRQGHQPYRIRSISEEIYDVTGTRDTVTAIMSLAIANGYDLQLAVQLASAAYDIVVKKLGSATVSFSQLQQCFVGARLSKDKILASIEQAKTLIAYAKQAGQKIVFTNGCYDVIHVGHIACLKAAKKQGDILIVAVNSDESVKRQNKGPNRPFFPIAARMNVLAEIEAVDWVIAFSDDTPMRLIQAFKPDILIKGTDYKKEEVIGAEIVLEYGGEVLTVGEHYPDCSSTRIINQLTKNPRRSTTPI